MIRRLILFLIILGLASLALSACASAPKMIASFPSQVEPAEATDTIIDYTATITLEVWNQKTATKQASSLARRWGGYIEHIRFETHRGNPSTILDLALPSQHFYDLRQDLLNLGTLVDETIIGESSARRTTIDPDRYSHLRLVLTSAQENEPVYAIPGWSPWHTLQQAYAVAVKITRFLVDATIWIIVIASPFFLLGYLVYRLGIKRSRPG